jgi:hypothetical protein
MASAAGKAIASHTRETVGKLAWLDVESKRGRK